LLRAIRRLQPRLPVLFAAAPDDPRLILEVFRLGAVDILELPTTRKNLEYALLCLQSQFNQSVRPLTFWNWIVDKINVLRGGVGFADGATSEHHSPLLHKSLWRSNDNRYSRRLLSEAAFVASGIHSMTHPQILHTSASAAPGLVVRLLGPFQVELNAVQVTEWSGHKAKLLFAYLAYHHQRHIYRDVLMDKFWPHSTPDSARNCLNVTLHAIRASMQKVAPILGEYLHFKEDCYFFPEEMHIELDTDHFTQYWTMAQNAERQRSAQEALRYYEAAASIYRGDLLEEFPYESWVDLERENLAETYLVILDKISGYYAMDGQPATAISICEQILQKDNCREEIYRRLMLCYHRIGQREKAIRAFQRCIRVLKETLDVAPTAATLTLYRKICSQQP